jgi:hypothetical protein
MNASVSAEADRELTEGALYYALLPRDILGFVQLACITMLPR